VHDGAPIVGSWKSAECRTHQGDGVTRITLFALSTDEGGGAVANRGTARPPTMSDVARLAGVSTQTVSRVLNDYEFIKPGTRDKVLGAIESLGYRPNAAARTLATSRSRVIGVVASDYMSFGPASALWAVEQAAHDSGYGVSVVSLGETTLSTIEYALRRLADQAVEGIVMIAPQDAAVRATQASIHGIPVVTLSGFDEGYDHPIMVDSVEGSRLATKHLIDLGHRRILHLSGPTGFEVSELRVRGWRLALSQADLPAPEPFPGDWTAESGYRAGIEMAADLRATAAYVAQDRMAQGLLLALHRAGRRVPEDFSVVSFDDVPEAAYTIPPLTTVRQDFGALGRRAVDALLARITGDEPPSREPLVPELVVRESTAPPPAR
jgi:DNA-binding LacI/PurR family transcriptional regulator